MWTLFSVFSGKEPPVKSESGQSDQNAVESTTRDASVVEDDVKPSTSGYDPKSEANASRNDLQFSSDDDDVKVIKDVPVKRSSRKGRSRLSFVRNFACARVGWGRLSC